MLRKLAGATACLAILSACSVADDGALSMGVDPTIETAAIPPEETAPATGGEASGETAGEAAETTDTTEAVETAEAAPQGAEAETVVEALTGNAEGEAVAAVSPESAAPAVSPEAPAAAAPAEVAQAAPEEAAPTAAETAEPAAAAAAAETPQQQQPESGASSLTALAEQPKRSSPFSRLFSRNEAAPPVTRPANSREPQTVTEPVEPDVETAEADIGTDEPAPAPAQITTASIAGNGERARLSVASTGAVLPGVREVSSLYQFSQRDGFDYTSYADDNGTVRLASAAGLAGLAGGRLAVQHERVDVACLKPRLVQTLKRIEAHFGRPVLVTSGFRDRGYNRKVGGARESRHMYCEAADIQIPGVSKWDIAEFARSLPGRGGVGTYCHTESVHVDIGSKRDWNWRCRRRS